MRILVLAAAMGLTAGIGAQQSLNPHQQPGANVRRGEAPHHIDASVLEMSAGRRYHAP